MSPEFDPLSVRKSTGRGYTIGLKNYDDGLSCDLEFTRHVGSSSYILLRLRAADGPSSTWEVSPAELGESGVAPSGLVYEMVAPRDADIQPAYDALDSQLEDHDFGCFTVEYFEYPMTGFSGTGASMAGFALGSVIRDGPPSTQGSLDRLRTESVEHGELVQRQWSQSMHRLGDPK